MGLNIKIAFDFIKQRYPKYQVSIEEMALKKQRDNGMVPCYDEEGSDFGHANEDGIQGCWTYDYHGEIKDRFFPRSANYYGADSETTRFRYLNSKKVEEQTYRSDVIRSIEKYDDRGNTIMTKRYWSNGNLEKVIKYDGIWKVINGYNELPAKTEYEYGLDGVIKSENLQYNVHTDKQRGREQLIYNFNDEGQKYLTHKSHWLVGLNADKYNKEDHLKETQYTQYWANFDGKEIPMSIVKIANGVKTTTYFNKDGKQEKQETENS